MKRGATRQLTKDEDVDDDRDDDGRDDDEEPQQGLQLADAATLAKRPMKSLPKRRGAGASGSDKPQIQVPKNGAVYFGRTRDPSEAAAATATSEPEPAPKFGGFGGFGTTSNPFGSAVVAPPTPAAVSSTATSFPFGQPSTASSNDAPAVSSSASQATKNFASFLSSTSTNGATVSDKAEKTASDDDALLKEEVDYLSHIRGLNVSLLTTVKSAIENDPFVDIGSLLETYQSLRLSEKKRFDEKVGGLKAGPAKETEKKNTSAPTSAFAQTSMPKAPGSFSFGAPPKPSGGESEGTTSTTSSTASDFKFTSSASGSSPFTFGSSSSTPLSAPSGLASPFSFGAPPASSKGSAFSSLGKGRPSSEDKSGDSSASSGSAFIFGKASDKDKGPDTDKDKDKGELKSAFSSSASGGSLFGAPSASSSGTSLFGAPSTPSAFTSPEKPFSASSSTSSGFAFSTPPKFTLGAAPAASTGGFGGFGKPPAVGSIGNPVGFGFGSPPKESEDAAGPSASNAPKPFVFGPPKDKQPAEAGAEGADAKEAGDEPPPPLFAGSVHDKEGEGEEDETTMHEIRSKVYKMVKDDEGQNRWAEQGVGVLRLKKHKENDSRRVLLRNSSTGKVVINFRIYSGMNAKADKNVVSFIGHENGAQATYRIRTKTEEQAVELKSALDREIEFVRSKSPSS